MYTFECPKKLVEQFKRQAKGAFPKETISYVYGQIVGDNIIAEGLWTPDNVLDFCTKDTIYIQPNWYIEAIEEAKENDAVILADIHSHPVSYKYSYAVSHMPSESDILSRGLAWQQITGICVVREAPSGRLSSSIKFWGPTVPLQTIIK